MNKILLIPALALAAMIGSPAQAMPISATLNLDTVYTGSIPDGPAPWLVATFTSTGSTTGTLTLTSKLVSPDFVQGLNSAKGAVGWAFFLNQSLVSVNCSLGACADNGSLFGGSYNSGPVPGPFNLAFGWTSGNRFDGNDFAVYNLTFSSALTGNPFVENAGGWSSVAHVQGIDNTCSGWIVSGTGKGADGGSSCTPTHNVPEPAGLGVFGVGVLLVGLFVGLRRRWV